MMDLSIIIVSYNTASITLDCLRSIKRSMINLKYEIIIVDNNSTDNSIELVSREFPSIKIIQNEKNNWFAKANNQGAEIASGKYLLLLNSDTIVEEGNVERLYEFLETSNKQVVCVGPVVLNKDKTLQSKGYALSSVFERITMCFNLNKILPAFLARKILPFGTPEVECESHRVGWVSGCCMMIRRDIYNRVGGLNEKLEFYGEEPELGYRLHKLGYETWICTSSSIVHLGGMSTSKKERTEEEVQRALWRYAQLQKYTVGLRTSIWMSRIVIFAGYVKLICSSNKEYFKSAIKYENRVVETLKTHQ